jgi:hypothetical protein
MEHTKHLWRIGALLLLLAIGVSVGRHFLVPSSFGEMGHFRYDALFEFYAIEPAHAGQQACAECHDDAMATKAGGAHAAIQCEVCHDVLTHHVADGEWVAEMPTDTSTDLCALCHLAQPARPDFMPQIVLAEHLELSPGARPADGACLECHEAHDP